MKLLFSINDSIKKVVDPLIIQIQSCILGIMTQYMVDTKNLTLNGSEIYSTYSENKNNQIVIETKLTSINHIHSFNDFPSSISAIPNTIVIRDDYGNIYSGGIDINNTGYKLSNGNDLNSIFKYKDENFLEIEVIQHGFGDIIENAYLEKDENNEKIYFHLFLR